MAVGQHNPSRRALLGAVVAVSFEAPVRQAHRLLGMSGEPSAVRPGPWRRAVVRFEAAEAELARFERFFCSGRPSEEQDALEDGYGDRSDAMYDALRRLLRVRAPDLPALGRKIVLAVDHEVGTLSGGEACLATLKRDAIRLCSGKVDPGSGPG